MTRARRCRSNSFERSVPVALREMPNGMLKGGGNGCCSVLLFPLCAPIRVHVARAHDLVTVIVMRKRHCWPVVDLSQRRSRARGLPAV